MSWVPRIYYPYRELLKIWRAAVIRLLREALAAGQLNSQLSPEEIQSLLTSKGNIWWSLRIQSFYSKFHFLRYAGRYVRRPPIAQRRIAFIGDGIVRFWYKDKELRCRVEVQCSLEEFIDRWISHVRDKYQHSVRGFGLFGSRSVYQISETLFKFCGQEKRPRPKRLPWAMSIKRDFGRDRLIHVSGMKMQFLRYLAPVQA